MLLACGLLSGCSKYFPVEKEETGGGADIPSATRDIFAMDTVMTVTAYGDRAEDAIQAAADEIDRLDMLFSVGEPSSDISKLNAGKTAQVSGETMGLIQRSQELYRSTKGALNIAVYPLMKAWGFTTGEYRVPETEELASLLQHMDVEAIACDQDTGKVTLPEAAGVDLGAIAKGYTSSCLMDIFAEYGLRSGIVSLGGNVQVYRDKPDGTKWRVAVEDPFGSDKQDYAGILEVENKAVITSGAYERYFEQDGKRYHHILDPATGYPADSGLASVTIVSGDGALADGLSTALFVMGKEEAIAYWREHETEFDVILIEESGDMTVSAGLKDCFTSDKPFTVVERE